MNIFELLESTFHARTETLTICSALRRFSLMALEATYAVISLANDAGSTRWSALLAAHHGEALELAAKAIAGDPTVAPPLPALRALRAAFVLPEPTHPAAPAVLRALLTLAGDGR